MKNNIFLAGLLALVLLVPIPSRAATEESMAQLIHSLSELVQTYRASMGLPSVLGASTSIDDYLAGLRAQMKAIQDSDPNWGKTYTGETGVFIMLFGDGGKSRTESVTKEESIDVCTRNKKNNPTMGLTCSWNGIDITPTNVASTPKKTIGKVSIEKDGTFTLRGLPDALAPTMANGWRYLFNAHAIDKSGKSYRIDAGLDESQPLGSSYTGSIPWWGLTSLPKGKYTVVMDIDGVKAGSSSYDTENPLFTATKKGVTLPFDGAPGGTVLIEATTSPTCVLTASPTTASLNERVKISWTSTNAKKLEWIKDTSGKDNLKISSRPSKLEGSIMVKMIVLGNPFLTMKATSKTGETVTCTVVIPVSE